MDSMELISILLFQLKSAGILSVKMSQRLAVPGTCPVQLLTVKFIAGVIIMREN